MIQSYFLFIHAVACIKFLAKSIYKLLSWNRRKKMLFLTTGHFDTKMSDSKKKLVRFFFLNREFHLSNLMILLRSIHFSCLQQQLNTFNPLQMCFHCETVACSFFLCFVFSCLFLRMLIFCVDVERWNPAASSIPRRGNGQTERNSSEGRRERWSEIRN